MRKISQVIVKIVKASQGALYGPLHYRNPLASKVYGLKKSKGN